MTIDDILEFGEWTKSTPCKHPEHNFPTGLYIKPGESYTHVCPACGKEETVTMPKVEL